MMGQKSMGFEMSSRVFILGYISFCHAQHLALSSRAMTEISPNFRHRKLSLIVKLWL